jgi:hypothetical protein
MLGVRIQTPNDLVLIESGSPPVCDLIKRKQINFLAKIRPKDPQELLPVSKAINIANSIKSPMSVYLKDLWSPAPTYEQDKIIESQDELRN